MACEPDLRDAFRSQHREKTKQGASATAKETSASAKEATKEKKPPKKKSRARSPALKIVSTLFPENLDLVLIDGATLLVRARVPPETWTTRLRLAASLRQHW
jgi:hypothetical protein